MAARRPGSKRLGTGSGIVRRAQAASRTKENRMGTLGDSMTKTTMKAVVEEELGEEVIAVSALSQGKPPSILSMVTGAALIGLVRPRASKALPKRFLLAVTPDR